MIAYLVRYQCMLSDAWGHAAISELSLELHVAADEEA